jgi:hypothetical protein
MRLICQSSGERGNLIYTSHLKSDNNIQSHADQARTCKHAGNLPITRACEDMHWSRAVNLSGNNRHEMLLICHRRLCNHMQLHL